MPSSKDSIKARRLSLFAGPLCGAFVFALLHYGIAGPKKLEPRHSIIFGSATHWSSFMKGFAPLDLAVTCICVSLLFYVMLRSFEQGSSSTFGMFLGVFLGSGAMFATCITPIFGWFFGLEDFVVAGFGMTVVMALLMGAMLAVGFISKRLAKLLEPLWAYMRNTPMFQPMVKLGEYINANDVSD